MPSTLSVGLVGRRFVISAPYSPALIAFLRRLPGAKWQAAHKHWSCWATPATAWEIVEFCKGVHAPLADLVIISDPVPAMAERFDWQLKAAAGTKQADAKDLPLPPSYVHEPWGHQRKGVHFLGNMNAAMLAFGMGTGKSKVAIDTMMQLGCESILILCPASVRGVWRREFERHWDAGSLGDIRPLILDGGSTAKKAERVRHYMADDRHAVNAVVTNYESAWREPLANVLLKHEWDCTILDESHRAKTHNSKVSRFAEKLGRCSRRRYCLTGTPMGQSPLDLFGQFRFLDPGVFGTSWTQFKARYAVCGNVMIPQQITGYQNEEELQAKFHAMSYRVGAEVLDLPPVTHDRRTFALSAKAQRIYRELEEDLIASVGEGVVTIKNPLGKLLRLQQVTSGYLPLDDDRGVEQIESGKAALLEDLLEDLQGERVVVFCRFTHDLREVERVAAKLKRCYGELSGHRNDMTDLATLPDDVDVMGVQIKSGREGIDFTAASYGICYSVGFSLTDYEQMLARIHRPGQQRHTHYYHLVAEGTVDERVYRALAARKQVVEAVLAGMALPAAA